jgi:long-chain acyl-CoA synthetase
MAATTSLRLESAQALAASAHVASNLLHDGFNPGDRICISATNSPELLITVLGALRVGIIPALISKQSTDREQREMSGDIGAIRVFHDEDIAKLMRSDVNKADIEMDLSEYPRCRPIHFTSGTTGRPKAVWSGWLDQLQAHAWISEEIETWGISHQDVHLVNGPMSHSAPLRFALMTIYAGGSVVIPARFDAAEAISLIEQGEVTTTFVAPTHLQRMKESNPHMPRIESMRLVAHAGATCPDHVRLWAHQVFGVERVFEFFGSTEGQFTCCPAVEWIQRPGTVGRARAGREITIDSEGQIWCRVPDFATFTYWGDEEKSGSTWKKGNWFTIGDFGQIDDDGFVYLAGRKGDLIITGGVNVYPAEIERVLTELPGVGDAIAFGMPDDTWGQRVCVAVQGSVSEVDIRTYLKVQLAGPKQPKSIYLIESFPRTHSGKIDRLRVLEMLN